MLKVIKKPHTLIILLAVIVTAHLTSCNNDDDTNPVTNTTTPIDDPVAEINYGLAMVSGSGNTVSTYVQGLKDLGATEINNSNGTEIGQFAAIYTEGSSLFTAGFGAPATMQKFVFNDEGITTLDQSIVVPGANSFSTVEIVSPTQGYATVGGGLARVVIFNPTTMKITGEIDISDAGEGLFYSDILVRDSHMFIALNDFGGAAQASLAVIDLSENKLDKIITDERTSTLFNTLTSEILTLADNGDIYVQATGLYTDKPGGILRIKKDQTDFDTEYFFDLAATVGKTCFGLYHFGDGQSFTLTSDDDANFFGTDGANPVFSYHKLNLSTKESLGVLSESLPKTFAASRTAFMMQISDTEILFPIAGTDLDAIYSYNPATGETSQKSKSSSGYITGIVALTKQND
ncbi:hypothetical protein ABW636_14390 [Aquimarina sp. 2201CG1-2-11]|uniref:hypothetical protein n=1 Tax=Aquimarina discodermiae TaxID=3231043 RepID=UPI003461E231